MPRLLLIKFGAIGDCVMLLPAAHAMHAAGWEIDWICGERVAPVLRLYPWIRVLAFDDRPLLQGGVAEKLRAMVTFRGLVRGVRYDLAAALYYDTRYRWLLRSTRAERTILLSKSQRELMLLPGRHHTDEYFRILSGRKDDELPTQLAPVRAEGLPDSPLPPSAKRVVLVPAGARNLLRDDALRRWPLTNYVALARLLLERGCDVVLAGGPDDTWASPAFRELGVVDLIDKLTLIETLALFESAAVTVTHDTGPLHLAGLTRTGVVAIFGPTDPRGRLPQRAGCVALWGGEGFACRPCYDGRDYAPCSHNGCMHQVTVESVLAEVNLMLAGELRPPRIAAPVSTSRVEFA